MTTGITIPASPIVHQPLLAWIPTAAQLAPASMGGKRTGLEPSASLFFAKVGQSAAHAPGSGVHCVSCEVLRIDGRSAGKLLNVLMVGALCVERGSRYHLQRRQDQVCPPLPTPGVTIYRVCHGDRIGDRTTLQNLPAGWRAKMWSADARERMRAEKDIETFAAERAFLGNAYSNNQAQYFAQLQCLFRALSLQDPHVILEVYIYDSCQTALTSSPLGWPCRKSQNININTKFTCQQMIRVEEALAGSCWTRPEIISS